MSSHKFSSTNHIPPSITRKHSPVTEKTSLPIHVQPYPDSEICAFKRKGSLPGSENMVYVSPCFSSQEQQRPSSPGKLVQKYMEHMVHPIPSSPKKHWDSHNQDSGLMHSQDMSATIQSSKATALVAPYTGDSTYKLPTPNVDVMEGFRPPRTKLVLMSESPQGNGDSSSAKWRGLVETKDSLLTQKSNLIERQKVTISQLRTQVQELEARNSLQLASSMRAIGDSHLNTRIWNLEHKNAALQAELASLQSFNKKEAEQLSKRLDSTEYELHTKTQVFSKKQEELQSENEQLHQQLTEKNSSLKDIEQRLQISEGKNKELSQHIVKLNGYFENMPTMEEYLAFKEHAEHQDKLCSSLTVQLADRDNQISTALAKHNKLEQSLAELEQTCADLRQELDTARAGGDEVSALHEENRKAMAECQRLQKLVFSADKRCQRELEAMRQRHRTRFQEATADLRARHKTVVKRMKMLEAQLLRNSDAMMAVNQELQLNQGEVSELKSSVKELLAQNQQLVEKNITLQEEASDGQSLRAQLVAVELTQCIKDFRSLLDLSSSLLEEKVTIPQLFGHSSDEVVGGVTSETDLVLSEGYDSLLEQSRRLKRDVECLREFVSEQLAIQLANQVMACPNGHQVSGCGLAIILTNDYCGTDRTPLNETHEDGDKMASVFSGLGYHVLHRRNLSSNQLQHFLHDFSHQCNSKSYSCIVIVFSGHGTTDRAKLSSIFTQDTRCQTFPINEIVNYFMPTSTPVLATTPKVFLIDACLGDKRAFEEAVTVPKSAGDGMQYAKNTEIATRGGRQIETIDVPPESNFILAHSTSIGYQAYEIQKEGAVWLSALSEKIRIKAHTDSVQNILADVSGDLMEKYQDPIYRGAMAQPFYTDKSHGPVYFVHQPKIEQQLSVGPVPQAVVPSFKSPTVKPAPSSLPSSKSILNTKWQQSKEISKPRYETTPQAKNGMFLAKVAFILTSTNQPQCFQSDPRATKKEAQEEAARVACKNLTRVSAPKSALRRLSSSPQQLSAIRQPSNDSSPMQTLKMGCESMKPQYQQPEYSEVATNEHQQFLFKVTVRNSIGQTVCEEVGSVKGSKQSAKHDVATKANQKLGFS